MQIIRYNAPNFLLPFHARGKRLLDEQARVIASDPEVDGVVVERRLLLEDSHVWEMKVAWPDGSSKPAQYHPGRSNLTILRSMAIVIYNLHRLCKTDPKRKAFQFAWGTSAIFNNTESILRELQAGPYTREGFYHGHQLCIAGQLSRKDVVPILSLAKTTVIAEW